MSFEDAAYRLEGFDESDALEGSLSPEALSTLALATDLFALGQTPSVPSLPSNLSPAQLAQLQSILPPGVNASSLSQQAITELSAGASAGFDSLSSDAKAQILADTGINVDTLPSDVKAQFQAWSLALKSTQGASDAISLLQNGFNPDDEGDKEKLIGVIAGGLALIPGVGPLLAGAVETLWQIGKLIACPVSNFFADAFGIPKSPDCGGQPCSSSGNWKVSDIAGCLPTIKPGSFADMLVASVGTYAVQVLDCKAGWTAPDGSSALDHVVDGVVAIWNATHQGPAMDYWIPPLAGFPIIATSYNNNQQECDDFNVVFAFQPRLIVPVPIPIAKGLVPQQLTPTTGATTFGVGNGLGEPIAGWRYVSVNTGPLIPPASAAPSTAATVATVAVLGTAAVGGGLWLALGTKGLSAAVESLVGSLVP